GRPLEIVTKLEPFDGLRVGAAAGTGCADEDTGRVRIGRRIAGLRRVAAGLAEKDAEVTDRRYRVDRDVDVHAVEVVGLDLTFAGGDRLGPCCATRLSASGQIDGALVAVDEDDQDAGAGGRSKAEARAGDQ